MTMEDNPAFRALMALAELAAATVTLMVIWSQMPAAQRELMILTLRQCLRGHAARLARASGRRAMGRELAGTPQDRAGYDLAYRLSELRDRL
jgi:hypothetical protein